MEKLQMRSKGRKTTSKAMLNETMWTLYQLLKSQFQMMNPTKLTLMRVASKHVESVYRCQSEMYRSRALRRGALLRNTIAHDARPIHPGLEAAPNPKGGQAPVLIARWTKGGVSPQVPASATRLPAGGKGVLSPRLLAPALGPSVKDHLILRLLEEGWPPAREVGTRKITKIFPKKARRPRLARRKHKYWVG
jgi:hypothetical protein